MINRYLKILKRALQIIRGRGIKSNKNILNKKQEEILKKQTRTKELKKILLKHNKKVKANKKTLLLKQEYLRTNKNLAHTKLNKGELKAILDQTVKNHSLYTPNLKKDTINELNKRKKVGSESNKTTKQLTQRRY